MYHVDCISAQNKKWPMWLPCSFGFVALPFLHAQRERQQMHLAFYGRRPLTRPNFARCNDLTDEFVSCDGDRFT